MSGIVYNPKSLAYNPEWKPEGHDCDTCPATAFDPRSNGLTECEYHKNRRLWELTHAEELVDNGAETAGPCEPETAGPVEETVVIDAKGKFSGWGAGKLFAEQFTDPAPDAGTEPRPTFESLMKGLIEETTGATARLESIEVDVTGPDKESAARLKEVLETLKNAFRNAKPDAAPHIMDKLMGFMRAPDKEKFMRGEILKSLEELHVYMARSVRVAVTFGWLDAGAQLQIAATAVETAIKNLKAMRN